MKKDIENRKDINFLIQYFYDKLKNNQNMSVFFENTNFEQHLPRMCDFWDFIIFSTPNIYKGSLMPIHQHLHEKLSFSIENFQTWVDNFCETADTFFEGKNTETAKQAAKDIASTMKYKILGNLGRKFDFKVE